VQYWNFFIIGREHSCKFTPARCSILNIVFLANYCQALQGIAHGRVNAYRTDLNATVGIGCDVGYSINGTSFRTCQKSRQWSGSHPTCECKFILTDDNGKHTNEISNIKFLTTYTVLLYFPAPNASWRFILGKWNDKCVLHDHMWLFFKNANNLCEWIRKTGPHAYTSF
jgi:hypothetical protein